MLTEGYTGVTSFVRNQEAPVELIAPLVEAGFRLEHYVEGCDAFRQVIPGAFFGPKWEDYSVALFGLQLPNGARSSDRADTLVMTFSLSDGDVEIEVWRRLVRTSQSQAYVDARWNPDHGLSISIAGVETITRLADLQPVTRGIRLLKEMDKRGKKPVVSRDHPNRESLQSELRSAFTKLHRKNILPTPETVAARLVHPKSRRRMDELIHEYGLREWMDDEMRRGRSDPKQ